MAAWLTAADNPYFANSYVNRLWGYLLGTGIIEPLDDIRAGNPPTNPELLDYLTREFIDHHFDMRHVLRLICRSRTYQLSIDINRWNDDDRINYSHAIARRLPAEVLYDAIHRVTGSVSRIPGVPVGTRAAALPDSGVNLADGFLSNLGRPARESVCECERIERSATRTRHGLDQRADRRSRRFRPQSELAKLAASEKDDAKLVGEIFLRVLNRPATMQEIEAGLAALRRLPEEHKQLAGRLAESEQQSAAATARLEESAAEGHRPREARRGGLRRSRPPRKRPPRSDERQQQIAKAEAALRESEKTLPQRMAAWEQQARNKIAWTPLVPSELAASNNAKLTPEADRAVVAAGPNGKATYVVVAESDLPNVSGLRLEALADGRLPAKGPGRAANGNFVLSQLIVEWRPLQRRKRRRRQAMPVSHCRTPRPTSARTITTCRLRSGKSPDKGWAVVPQTGQSHTAVFETRDVLAAPGIFTIRMVQNFPDGQHTLGRFRISVTNAPRPITLERLPANIADILAVAGDKRTGKQKAELLGHFRSLDPEWQQRRRPWPRRNGRCPSIRSWFNFARPWRKPAARCRRMPRSNGCVATWNSAPSSWQRCVSRSPRIWPGP